MNSKKMQVAETVKVFGPDFASQVSMNEVLDAFRYPIRGEIGAQRRRWQRLPRSN